MECEVCRAVVSERRYDDHLINLHPSHPLGRQASERYQELADSLEPPAPERKVNLSGERLRQENIERLAELKRTLGWAS